MLESFEQHENVCKELLSRVPYKFLLEAQSILKAPIIEEELANAVEDLAQGKCQRPNGLMIDFFKVYWCFMNVYFITMVNDSLACGHFLHPSGNHHLQFMDNTLRSHYKKHFFWPWLLDWLPSSYHPI